MFIVNTIPGEESKFGFERSSRRRLCKMGIVASMADCWNLSTFNPPASSKAGNIIRQEYSRQFGLSSLIDRCDAMADSWQLGKVDQGLFTFWMTNHNYGKPLKYIGVGGRGKQVATTSTPLTSPTPAGRVSSCHAPAKSTTWAATASPTAA